MLLYPLAILLLISSVIDIKIQKIPNWITFSSMIAGLVLNSFLNGVDGLTGSAAGILIGTGIFLIPYALGGMGAGDAKLMGAVGAFLGPKGVIIAALLTMAVGGFYAILLMLWHWQHGKRILAAFKDYIFSIILTKRISTFSINDTDTASKPKLCYGVAIAGGTFIYMYLESTGYNFPML